MKYKKRPLCLLLTFLLCFLTAFPALADSELELIEGGKKDGTFTYLVNGNERSVTLNNFKAPHLTFNFTDRFSDCNLTITLAEGSTNVFYPASTPHTSDEIFYGTVTAYGEMWTIRSLMEKEGHTPTLKIQGNGKLIMWAGTPMLVMSSQRFIDTYEAEIVQIQEHIAKGDTAPLGGWEKRLAETQERLERAKVSLADAYANATPAIMFDEGINVILDDSLSMVGGSHEGDKEPLTFVKRQNTDYSETYGKYCPVTADGRNAAYVEIAPAGFVSQSPEVPQESPVTASRPTQFEDVPDDAYYADAVKWAVENGVTNGVSETNFAPEDICNRGQVATFLWRAKGCPEPVTTVNPFTDVEPSSAFYKAILWAWENGITAGTSDTTFSPGNPCTRAHVVTFLWRAQGKPEANGPGTLADSFPQGYYTDAVRWADGAGLLSGTAEAFAPSALCPRADIVTYLYRNLA